MPKPEVTIYTDGACRPNPGPGGWAAILQWKGREQVLTGGHADTTNNRMELQAAIAGLHALKHPSQVDLYTDSTYLQRGITEWLASWVARGWRKADRRPVQNADLWRQLHELIGEHEVRWHWVQAHSGNMHNERVDSLAYAAIEGCHEVG